MGGVVDRIELRTSTVCVESQETRNMKRDSQAAPGNARGFRGRRIRWAIAIALAVAVVATGVILYQAMMVGDSDGLKPDSPPEDRPLLRFTGSRLVGRHQGAKQWELWVKQIEVEQDENVVAFDSIGKGIIYRRGKTWLTLEGGGGVYRRDTGDFMLQGNMVVRSDRGLVFKTDALTWQADKGVLHAPGTIYAEVEGNQIQAGCLYADLRENRYILRNDVTVLQQGERRIWTGELVYDMDNESVTMMGNGRIEIKTGR